METVLVLAANTVTYAATGHSLVLGKVNKANRATVVKRTTDGPALALVTKPTAAPFTVSSGAKVANLNADTVDGLDASALVSTTSAWTKAITTPSSSLSLALPLAPGTYVAGYDAYLVGGGTDNEMAGCYFKTVHAGISSYSAEDRSMTKTGQTPSYSGSSVLTVSSGDTVTFVCFAAASFQTTTNEPVHVYAMRTSVAGASALRVAPSAARTGQ